MTVELLCLGFIVAVLLGLFVWGNFNTKSSAIKHGPAPLDYFKSLEWCATMGHWLGGFFLLFVPTFWDRGNYDVLGWITGPLVLGVLFKEYVLDLHDESDEDVYSSTMDACGWGFGFVVAWGMTILGHGLRYWS